MKKAVDAFRSIGEVSQLVGVAPHVLRYWEAQFPLFSPVKRRDGRRYYRPDDVKLAAGLCALLREDGVSIRGAKKQMAADRGAALRARGAALVVLPDARGKVDLAAMLADLAQRGINELHVEAGATLNAALLQAGLVDELLVYLAPKLLGAGRDMAAFGPLAALADALAFEFTQIDRIGADLRILARAPGRADFLEGSA